MEKYYTRLTYNTNDWITPSGTFGKCNGLLYEAETGFGWEEWLFNKRTRKTGSNGFEYQYGFLECFNRSHFGAEKNHEKVYLYTRNCESDQYIAVAIIENLKKLSNEEALNINVEILNNGIKEEMRAECVNADGNQNYFDLGPCYFIVNAKFKIKDVKLLNISKDIHPVLPKSKRFLMNRIKNDDRQDQNLTQVFENINNYKTL